MGETACSVCFLRISPAERFSLPQLCLSCLLDILSGAETVPGQAGHRCPVLCQKQGSAPSLGKPRPSYPRLGPGLSSGFLETPLQEAEPEPVVFKLVLLPSIVMSFLFLATCSWMSPRWASRGLPGQPHHSIAHPVSSQAPQPPPCPAYIRFVPDSENQLSTSLPSCSLCVEFFC